ncbi:MAG: flippase-like domain-containing protein [Bacteroidales bacterium]|nr:flippase-like domain-containing protein [Bacteroidales bacterium]
MIFKTKIHKIYNYVIRFTIIIATYGFIYKQIFYKKKLENILILFEDLFSKPLLVVLFILVFLLMFVNWGIEAFKWKFLINKIEKVPFLRSFKAIFAGASVSVFTPNRVGEYFGRVFILKKANPWKGVFITIIGSMSQLLTTIILGSVSLLFFIPRYFDLEEYFSIYIYYGLFVIVAGLIILLILLFLNVSIITTLVNKIISSKWKRIRSYMLIFSYYSTFELMKVLLLSMLRYSVFTFQFYLLLRAYSVNIPFFEGVMIISVFYFTMTAIPTITLAELGIRGSVSIYLIGLYFEKFGILTGKIDIGTLAASSTLWLINLAFPALIGTLFVFNLKFFRKKS